MQKIDKENIVIKNRNSLTENFSLKILAEKRKRHQIYSALNHLITFNTYFDFFSPDTFKIAAYSRYLAQGFHSKNVTSDYLLLPFLEMDSAVNLILQEYGFTKKVAATLTKGSNDKSFFSLLEKISLNFNLPFLRKKTKRNNSIKFSMEINQVFEKAAENALSRFKTPVITSEILFITLMEQKNTKVGKFIAKVVSNKMQWYLLRYKLLKRIHNTESSIRNLVPKNEHFFAYLLKTQIPEIQFDRLIENEILALGILFFRNKLLSKIRDLSLSSCLEKEIYRSIKVTGTRKYSL